mmetsp:Transcript_2101/g.4796  ORF Transcript_2101/g.4796 Transcript_2101/m.4796 type:complete len:390 (+) Transcript_2101:2227-3396(+)
MREVDQRLAHRLVQRHHLDILQVLLDDLAVLVLDDQHLLGLGHALDEEAANLREDRGVGLEARGLLQRVALRQHERRHRALHLDLLVVQVVGEEVPVLGADLENLVVLHLRDVHQVLQPLDEVPRELLGLEDREVGLEDGGEEECEALHKLLPLVALLVVLLDRVGLDDAREVGDEVGVHLLHFGVVLGVHALRVDRRHLRQALQRVAPELRLREELVEEHVDEGSLERVVERDPEQEAQEALQRRLQRDHVLRVLHDKLAELVDELELLGEALLERLDLLRGELLERELKDLLAQQPQDLHVVPAQRLVRLPRLHDLRDEVLPVVRPLLLEDLDEDEVELRELHLGAEQRDLVRGVAHDHRDNVRLDRLALVRRQHLPSVLDAVLKRR